MTSLSIVDLSKSCDTTEFALTWWLAFFCFVTYSLGFPLVLLLPTRGRLPAAFKKYLPTSRSIGPTSALADSLSDLSEAAFGLPTGKARTKSEKFYVWCRISNIFRREHSGWMALLLWRRAFLVLCFIYASSSGGQLYLPSGLGVDFRLLPFILLIVYVVSVIPITTYLGYR